MSVNDTAAHLAEFAFNAATNKYLTADEKKAVAEVAAEAYQETL
jgi:hypothetical protein